MKTIKRLFFIILLVAVFFGGKTAYEGYRKFKVSIAEKPLETVIKDIRLRDDYTEYDDISQFYFDAVVAVEDRRFYDHKGFDLIGTARALINDIKNGKLMEGGSTISQQLAKNLYYPEDNTLSRKIAEIFMANHIEKECSKEEILELYANVVYFGSGYYNINDASKGYFRKNPGKLDEYEASMLAGIPNAPSVYSPDVNPDLASQRQRQVLKAMEDCGYIKKTDIERILNMGDRYFEG